ncbi:anti-sigma factor [Paraburkholderia strydomiana]|uniref:anti-sigma factor n=1 Tax=Paraburkholderia strydomiana TaxID=1245417 RepID=UPI001BE9B518|nr:zf-HC2 domain-containing protein [Paraburkholderia strydomiana]MBT2793378.1 zf-HC2 domain-containing protein [Paraburkholderia strydomiana]
MKMDDILLMAYVDGELTPHEREEVEKAIRTSADVAERVALLEASVLPYRRAFQQQALPPVPESLTRKIAELAHAYATPAAASPVGGNHRAPAPDSQPDPLAGPSLPVRSRLRTAAPWLAVAFVAGAFCCGVVLRFAPGAAQGGFAQSAAQVAGQNGMHDGAQGGASPWVMAAVSYQRLYTRDTVALDASNMAAAAHVVDNIRHDDGLPIRVPDLRSAGLTFKRIQRLRYNNKPLVQIVYLPEKGLPVALCVMKDEKADSALAQQQVDSMDVVTWRRDKLSYALIATPGDTDLGALGKRISESNVEELIGELSKAEHPFAS